MSRCKPLSPLCRSKRYRRRGGRCSCGSLKESHSESSVCLENDFFCLRRRALGASPPNPQITPNYSRSMPPTHPHRSGPAPATHGQTFQSAVNLRATTKMTSNISAKKSIIGTSELRLRIEVCETERSDLCHYKLTSRPLWRSENGFRIGTHRSGPAPMRAFHNVMFAMPRSRCSDCSVVGLSSTPSSKPLNNPQQVGLQITTGKDLGLTH